MGSEPEPSADVRHASERASKQAGIWMRIRGSPGFAGAWRLALIFAPLIVYKILLAAHTWDPLIDGGYYTDVARHVRDGEGLTTHVSLYHQAYSSFPHETSVYPLWPLVYGYAGRFFDLMRVGVWLPTGLYFVALIFAYLWGKRFAPRPKLFGFDAGHAVVLFLATTRDFYEFTSVPYTEGLAFTLLFIALWRVHPAWSRPSWQAGMEFGIWMALGMLARSQHAVFCVAAVMTFAFAVLVSPQRKKYALMGIVAVAAFAVCFSPHYVHVQQIVNPGGIRPLMAFEAGRESWVLSEMEIMVETHGALDYLRDRAAGVLVAFDYNGKHCYRRQFFWAHYALPLAALVCLGGLPWLRRRHLGGFWAWLRSDHSASVIFVCASGVGMLLLIHSLHKEYFSEWNFARRQSIACLLAFYAAWVFVARHKMRFVRILALALLLGSTALGARGIHNKTARALQREGPKPYKAKLAAWLNEEAERRGPFTVALSAQAPQRIAPFTRDVGYHWFYDKTTRRDIEVLVTELGADFVIMGPKTKSWRCCSGANRAWFRTSFKRVAQANGYAIYKPRGTLAESSSVKDDIRSQ